MATLCPSVGFGLHSLSCECRGRLIYKFTAFVLLFVEDSAHVVAQERKKLEIIFKVNEKITDYMYLKSFVCNLHV